MLTDLEIKLAREVGKRKLSKDTAMGIFAFLEQENQQAEMLRFLQDNRNATEQEILVMLKNIITR